MRELGVWGFTAAVWFGSGVWAQAPVERVGGRIDLPSSKQIVGVVPGRPQRLGSLPIAMAVSPNGRWVVTVNGGYGSFESRYMQSVAVLDTVTGKVVDYPDARTLVRSGQVLNSGLAFSADGTRVYGTIVSLTDPEGTKAGDTGSGVQVYSFKDGVIAPERVLKIPMQKLAGGRRTKLGKDEGLAVPYPAGIAVVEPTHHSGSVMNGARGGQVLEDRNFELILVADNLSDDVLEMDVRTGQIVRRFDLSENDAVPSTYPVGVVVSRDGLRGFVGLSNASEVVELDLVKGTVGRKLALLKPASAVVPGSRPTGLALSPDGRTLYAALANRDAVAAVDLGDRGFRLKGYFDTRLPGQSYFGALPEALAVNADGSRVYAANLGSDAVAVLDTRRLTKAAAAKGMVEPDGFIPTEWMPMGVAFAGGKVFVASGKGTGTGPNGGAQRVTAETRGNRAFLRSFTYIATLLHGSVATLDEKTMARDLKGLTVEVLEDNRMRAGAERIAWSAGVMGRVSGGPTHRDETAMNGARGSTATATATATATTKFGGPSTAFVAKDATNFGRYDLGAGAGQTQGSGSVGPIRHVIYLIKENRTYDQVFGDLAVNGKAVGNGDKSLTMYGAEVTPNLHKLALQFGVLDNFYDSGEVSGDGHVWSNAAINSDYNERSWQVNYRGAQHLYDYEGVVSEGIPLEQHIPDVAEPGTGYMWGNAEKHGRTHYNFGEFIASTFCSDKGAAAAEKDSQMGPLLEGKSCAQRNEVKPGERLPAEWGGEVNRWPWAIPLLAANHATKPELVGHFAAESPDFNLRVPDQIRVNVFLRHLDGWMKERAAGADTMPNFITMRLGNDHTAGTTVGGPTPKASVADNDLAVGRIVEAVSHSAFWEDTAICVLEDDAQNGADHVDAHRSLALVVSKYAPRGENGGAVVDSRFYSTVSMVRTMETLLGLPPMNNNDAFSSLIGSVFTGAGDQAAFAADRSNEVNGLIYTANKHGVAGAEASAKMDFRHEDRADARKLNVILWQDAMGVKPMPAMLTEKRRKKKDADDE